MPTTKQCYYAHELGKAVEQLDYALRQLEAAIYFAERGVKVTPEAIARLTSNVELCELTVDHWSRKLDDYLSASGQLQSSNGDQT